MLLLRDLKSRPSETNSRSNNGSTGNDRNRQGSGSIARLYEAYLVPLIFEPYAADLSILDTSIEPSRSSRNCRKCSVATGGRNVTPLF
jgi:hypothetical protein